jgi:hypothetical protein
VKSGYPQLAFYALKMGASVTDKLVSEIAHPKLNASDSSPQPLRCSYRLKVAPRFKFFIVPKLL